MKRRMRHGRYVIFQKNNEKKHTYTSICYTHKALWRILVYMHARVNYRHGHIEFATLNKQRWQ